MSDDKKDDKKDEKKDAGKKEAEASGGGIKSMLGPVLAVIVLVSLGAGLGIGGAKVFLTPPADPKGAGAGGAAAGGDGHGDGHGAGGGGDHGAEGGAHEPNLMHDAAELELGAITTNIMGQGGKRYIKMTLTLWVDKESLGPQIAGGGHGGGPTSLIKLLKQPIEQKLNTYTLTDLDSPAAGAMIEKDVGEVAERELRVLFRKELAKVARVIHRVVITDRLMQ